MLKRCVGFEVRVLIFSDPRRRESSRSDALDSESRPGTRSFVPRATYRILNIRGLENRARI